MSWIIDTVFVNDDGPNQPTELGQCVPVAAVTRESGSLDRENGADAPFGDRRQQALEARPVDAAASAAEIIVDDLDRGPTELPGTPVRRGGARCRRIRLSRHGDDRHPTTRRVGRPASPPG